MAAPKGNQFWKLRSKHGRDKIFSSPETLWEAACDYFDYVDKNPIEAEDNKGTKNLNIVKYKRPYTWDGLEIYLDIHSLRDYKDEENESYKDFSHIIHVIDKIIRNQKFEGAVIGIFKENIIARDLGLTDKKENTIKTPDLNNITPLTFVKNDRDK
jgi:hypothetical protein